MSTEILIEKIAAQVNSLPPLPQIAYRTLALLRNPESNMQDIANMIALDPMITRSVLAWANSAYYGLSRTVTTVHQAIMYLGQMTVRSIVLTACISGVMNRDLPGYGMDRGELWRHAIGVAIGARQVATRVNAATAEEAYFAGLLCDIGKLGFEVGLRGIDLNDPAFQDRPFEQVENELFGINHAALGSIIARKWMLPESICQTIYYHHRPGLANSQDRVVASAVHIADLASMMIGIGLGGDGLRYTADPASFATLNFREDDLPELINKISADVNSVADQFGIENI